MCGALKRMSTMSGKNGVYAHCYCMSIMTLSNRVHPKNNSDVLRFIVFCCAINTPPTPPLFYLGKN